MEYKYVKIKKILIIAGVVRPIQLQTCKLARFLFWFKRHHGHLPASLLGHRPHLFRRSRRLYSCRIRDGAKGCSLVGRRFAVDIFPFRLLQCLVVVVVVRIVWHVLINRYAGPTQSKCVGHVATDPTFQCSQKLSTDEL